MAELLNAERAANAIPAGISTDAKLTADCAAHDRYMAAGAGLTHTETRGSRGYSAGGAYAAANAVLARGAGWNDVDPYARAPLHLDQLLAPRLAVFGSADLQDFSCTTTFPGWTRTAPPVPTVYTVPGPGVSASPSEVASELPLTPAGLAGLNPAARTGPVLLVFVDAPGQRATNNPAQLSAATLTGHLRAGGGSHDRRLHPGPGGGTLAPYIASGGFSYPCARSPPARSTTPQSASASPARRPAPVVLLDPGSGSAQHVAGAGRFAHVQLRLHGRNPRHSGLPLAHGDRPSDPAPGGARGAGAPADLPGRTEPGAPRPPRDPDPAPLLRTCTAGRCSTTPGRTRRETVILSARLEVPLPAGLNGVAVDLSSPAFQLRDAPWSRTFARFTWRP